MTLNDQPIRIRINPSDLNALSSVGAVSTDPLSSIHGERDAREDADAVIEAMSAAGPPRGAKAPSEGSAAASAASAGAHPAREPPQPGALQLVAFAKAYSGLTDEEFRQVDAIIRKSTLEKFGPVRSVKPSLVFELGFEGINRSPRHKSGIAVRFPRMLRIRHDKPLHEASTLQDLEALLKL